MNVNITCHYTPLAYDKQGRHLPAGLSWRKMDAKREGEIMIQPDRNSYDTIPSVNPQVRIGHVHLKVADIERSLAFYCGVLGFELTQRFGVGAAFISAGGYHHHIGMNTWESLGGSPPPPGTTGLYHLAILYPTRATLADALRRLIDAGIQLDGAADHGVSEALYLRDPDENGVELYWDRPREAWPRTPDGELAMYTRRLDLEDLLAAA
jgi:catechol 2,3-dioxygenase